MPSDCTRARSPADGPKEAWVKKRNASPPVASRGLETPWPLLDGIEMNPDTSKAATHRTRRPGVGPKHVCVWCTPASELRGWAESIIVSSGGDVGSAACTDAHFVVYIIGLLCLYY